MMSSLYYLDARREYINKKDRCISSTSDNSDEDYYEVRDTVLPTRCLNFKLDDPNFVEVMTTIMISCSIEYLKK